MQTTGKDLLDIVYDRVTAAVTPIPVYYQGVQAATAEYVLFLLDDEREEKEWSDKDETGLEVSVTLQLWGAKPRTLADRARLIIEDLMGTKVSPSGFTGQIVTLSQNSGQPALTLEGEKDQYSRIVRLSFVQYPD